MHLSSTILLLKDTFTRQIRPLCTVLTIVNTSSKTCHENRVNFTRKYFNWISTQSEVLSSVTRLGDFLNFSATCFITKVAQMFVTFWPVVKSNAFYVKLVRLLLGQLLKKLGLLFISTSGHTGSFPLISMCHFRFTHHATILEPMFVIGLAYASYLNAELFHMSGILAITFFGIAARWETVPAKLL